MSRREFKARSHSFPNYWLHEPYVGIGKEDRSLGHRARDRQDAHSTLLGSRGSLCPPARPDLLSHLPPGQAAGVFQEPSGPEAGRGRWRHGHGDSQPHQARGQNPRQTGNGHQLYRQSPHLSWNLQDWPHIWSQVLGPAQVRTEKPRGDFSFSHRTSAGKSWRDHLVQNLHFVDQETEAQERRGPGVVGQWALYKERPRPGFPVAGDTTASLHWNDTRSGFFSSPASLSVPPVMPGPSVFRK